MTERLFPTATVTSAEHSTYNLINELVWCDYEGYTARGFLERALGHYNSHLYPPCPHGPHIAKVGNTLFKRRNPKLHCLLHLAGVVEPASLEMPPLYPVQLTPKPRWQLGVPSHLGYIEGALALDAFGR